jgi:hypothetical protein
MADEYPPPDDAASPPFGGSGELGALEDGIRQTRRLARAVRERWAFKEEWRPAIMDRLMKTAVDPGASPRESTQACRALLEADRLNLAAQAVDDFDERLRALEGKHAEPREPLSQARIPAHPAAAPPPADRALQERRDNRDARRRHEEGGRGSEEEENYRWR